MRLEYSTFDAKTKFSEVVRLVRSGKSITITYRGKPVAEIRPLKEEKSTLEEHLAELERRGALTSAKGRKPLKPIAHRPGALERFLEDRSRF